MTAPEAGINDELAASPPPTPRAEWNIAAARLLEERYLALLGIICAADIRIPQLEVITGPSKREDVAGSEGVVRRWVQRERNLRLRRARISRWRSPSRSWSARRGRIRRALASARVRALQHLSLDRRLIDCFTAELVIEVERAKTVAARAALGLRYQSEQRSLRRAARELREVRARIDALKAELVRMNMGLVIKIAAKFIGRGLPMEDLIQEGSLGLLRGIEKFDPGRGCQFSTYATWWVRQSVSRAVADQSRMVRIPSHANELLARARRVERELAQRGGGRPPLEEVARQLGCEPRGLEVAKSRSNRHVSLSKPIGGDASGELLDTLASDDGLGALESTLQSVLRARTVCALDRLDARSRFVIEARYGIRDEVPQTLDQIGRALGVSRERARQIETTALRRLQRLAMDYNLDEFA